MRNELSRTSVICALTVVCLAATATAQAPAQGTPNIHAVEKPT